MRVRTDFVTNSSSSSFIICRQRLTAAWNELIRRELAVELSIEEAMDFHGCTARLPISLEEWTERVNRYPAYEATLDDVSGFQTILEQSMLDSDDWDFMIHMH